MLTGEPNWRKKDSILKEVTPFNLGFETYGDRVKIVIPKDAVFPCLQKIQTATWENQSAHTINVSHAFPVGQGKPCP